MCRTHRVRSSEPCLMLVKVDDFREGRGSFESPRNALYSGGRVKAKRFALTVDHLARPHADHRRCLK